MLRLRMLVAAVLVISSLGAVFPTAAAGATAGSRTPSGSATVALAWGSCWVYAYAGKYSTYTVEHKGSQYCSGSGIYSESVTIYEDRCSFELFGTCITWEAWHNFGTVNQIGGGWLYNPTNGGWWYYIPGEGTYKTRTMAAVDTTDGWFYGKSESGSVVVPN